MPTSRTPNPRVAIITRTRGRPLMLPRCLRSVLAQEFEDWEHWIVNDGGDQRELEALLEPFHEGYRGRLRVLHNADSRGMQEASNQAIEASESVYLAVHDDDDTWEPAFLRRTVEVLNAADAGPATPVGGVVTQLNWIVEEIRDDALVETWRGDYMPHERIGLLETFHRNPTAPIAFLYRREAHEQLGLYDPRYDVLGDWVFLLDLLRDYEVISLPEKLANYHWRASGSAPPAYANTVTAQLKHHLDLRNQLVNDRLREALKAVPAIEGPLLALAQPLLETAAQVRDTRDAQQRHASAQQEGLEQVRAEVERLREALAQSPSREAFASLEERLREILAAQQEALADLGRVKEELARAKEREFWFQKALDHHSVQLDWTRGTLDRHSGELHELLARSPAGGEAAGERGLLSFRRRDDRPRLTQEMLDLNDGRYDEADEQSDAACLAAARFAMQRAEVVSFDVFDTALLRRSGDPQTVFQLVEGQLDSRQIECPGFAAKRVQAEAAVRQAREKQGIGDITFDEIYAHLGAEHGLPEATLEALKTLELETEARVCEANPTIRQLVEECLTAQRKVVFVSDMYLPQAFIESLLQAAGYPPLPLLLSSSHRCTKHTGRLFDVLLEQVGVAGDRILHIGDNPTSDLRRAGERGIHTVLWEGLKGGSPYVEQVVPPDEWRHKPLFSRLARGLARRRRANLEHRARLDQLWETIGYEIAGPVYYSFLNWVIARARAHGTRTLFFLARDGYYLTEAFQLLRQAGHADDLQGTYLYASRRLYNLASQGFVNDRVLRFLLSPNPYLRVRDFIERIGLDARAHRTALARHGFKRLNAVLTLPQGGFRRASDRDRLGAFFRSIAPELETLAREEGSRLADYFRAKGLEEPDTAVVDLGWGATSLLAIQEILAQRKPGHRQRGFYFGTWEFAQPVIDAGCQLESYFMHLATPPANSRLLTGVVEALEFIFTAPHGSIEGVEERDGAWHPVEAPLENSPAQMENLRRMHEAGLAFIRDLLALGIEPTAYDPVEGGYLQAAFDRFLQHPTAAEAEIYGRLQMRDSFGSRSRLRPLATLPPRRLRRRTGKEGLETAYWKPGYAALVRGES